MKGTQPLPSTKTYRTVQGDTWDWVAKKLGWPETAMHKLIEANPDYKRVLVFDSGAILTVPDYTPAQVEVTLPPWKAAS